MRRLEYIATTAAQGFWRNPVMSLASTFTIGLMLLLFAFFLATDRGLQAAVGVLESKVELALFLEDDARVSDILALKARIEADPAVSRVDFVTKEHAIHRLTDCSATLADFQIVDFLRNPFPASVSSRSCRFRSNRRSCGSWRRACSAWRCSWAAPGRCCRSGLIWRSRTRTVLTQTRRRWDDSPHMGTPRTTRGGGVWRKRLAV